MAVVAVTGKPAAGVNYTVTTASSADWASVSNSTYFYDLTDKLVHYKDSTGTILEIYGAGGGGLTYFTEAQNTTAPNATVPVDSLTAVTATTNGDIAIVPKGTGAFALAVADSLVAGGNKRGANAIDLQTKRSANSQVASGARSFTAGSYNTASADDSVAIGQSNVANAFYSVAIGLQTAATGSYSTSFGFSNNSSGQSSFTSGYSNIASGSFSVALGNGNTASNTGSVSLGQSNNVSGISGFGAGSSNVNSGNYSAVFGQSNTISGQWTLRSGYGNGGNASYSITSGYNNITSGSENGCFGSSSNVTGDYAFSLGYQNVASGYASTSIGQKANTFGISGRKVFSSGGYVAGDSQKSILNLRIRTTNATPTVLTSDAGVSGTTNQLILQDNNSIRFKGTIIGRQSGSTNTSAWDIDGVIQRGVGVATTTLLISNVNLVINLNIWGTPTLTADVTNGALNVSVIGIATTNIQWSCTLETTEVIYA